MSWFEMGDLRPFDPSRDKPRQNPDGSHSTEVSRTVRMGNGWANVPSLWLDSLGKFVDLADRDDDYLGSLASHYERAGTRFPRFGDLASAVSAAKQRSSAGGASHGQLAKPDQGTSGMTWFENGGEPPPDNWFTRLGDYAQNTFQNPLVQAGIGLATGGPQGMHQGIQNAQGFAQQRQQQQMMPLKMELLRGQVQAAGREADMHPLNMDYKRSQITLAQAQAERARREAAEGGGLGKQFMPYYDPETGITYAVQAGPRGPHMTPLLTPEAPQASQGVPTDQMPGAGAARFAQPGVAPPQQRRPLRAIGTTIAGDTMFDRFGNPIRNVGQNIASAASMKEQGQLQGKAAFDLGTAVQKGEEGIRLIGELEKHPGRATGTGLSGTLDPRNYFAGTDATNFHVRVQQLQGQVFLEAYEALKGAGQITEIEGAKAERAKARLSTAQSDEEFLVALKELKDVLSAGVERAKRRATPVGGAPAAAPSSAPDPLGIR